MIFDGFSSKKEVLFSVKIITIRDERAPMKAMRFKIPLFFSKAELVDAGIGYKENAFVRSVRKRDQMLQAKLASYGYSESALQSSSTGLNLSPRSPQMESKR